MKKNILIYWNKIRAQLWFRPLLFCLFSVGGALVSSQADGLGLDELVPDIETETIGGLLDTISASMLVIAIFAVGSMLSAFSAASSNATPRSFKIVVTDDVSQYALSVFIGSFIFSIVATIALDNGYYGKTSRFLLFISTLLLFTVVILTFLKWVDRISKLGRLEHIIAQIETVTTQSLVHFIKNPYLKALPISGTFLKSSPIKSNCVGYIQHINLEELQLLTVEKELKIRLNCIPGKAIHENTVLAYVSSKHHLDLDEISKKINSAIYTGPTRSFEEDPRFGFIALSEIASRALSPGINDPGTAIQIIASHERLFFLWNTIKKSTTEDKVLYHNIEVPTITMDDFFTDAFRPIARDGATNIEVMLRLQKAFKALDTMNQKDIKEAALLHSIAAYNRAKSAITFEEDLALLKEKSLFS